MKNRKLKLFKRKNIIFERGKFVHCIYVLFCIVKKECTTLKFKIWHSNAFLSDWIANYLGQEYSSPCVELFGGGKKKPSENPIGVVSNVVKIKKLYLFYWKIIL